MNPLTIQIDANLTAFCPGDSLRGVIGWKYDDPPGRIELRLIWFTQGPGPDDVGIVDSLVLSDPLPADARAFQFRLPAGPYSYSGQSFRILWALELLAQDRKDFVRAEFVMSPTHRPIAFTK